MAEWTITKASTGNTHYVSIPYNDTNSSYSWTVNWASQASGTIVEQIGVRWRAGNGNGYAIAAYEKVNGAFTQRMSKKSGSLAEGRWNTLWLTDSRAWENKTSGTIKLTFYRVSSGVATLYNYIELVIQYRSAAEQSIVYVQPATAGEPQVVTLSNTDPDVYHDVRWQYAESSGTFGVDSGVVTIPAANRNPSWAVPAASVPTVFRATTDSPIHMGQVVVTTYTPDGTSVGTQTVDAKLYLPENETTKPTITAQSMSISHDPTAQAIRGIEDYEDAVIQNHSTAGVSVSATGYEGAGIAQIQILAPEGATAASLTSSGGTYTGTRNLVIRAEGDYPIGIRVVDTRGFAREIAQQWLIEDVLAYQDPTITSLQAMRCDQHGNAQEDGSWVWIEATAVIADLEGNELSMTALVREKGSDSGGYEAAMDENGASWTKVLGRGELSDSRSYVITVTAEDAFGITGEAQVEIGTGIMTISRMAGGKGVAFGKAAERYGVEITEEWPFYTHGQEILRLIVDIAHPVGSSLECVGFDPNDKWPWTIWAEDSGKWTRGV